MTNKAPGAVFLSYASQDAEAAKRICSALRGAGVEVWFDQSELRGGDAWDQKIRRQIKECGLFLPVISANTQRRAEGYFRLEWRLADQRTHLMGRSRPFIVPICVDETKDAEADVPDSFVSVQWTRLPAGESPSGFCERVKALLSGEPAGSGPPPPAAASPGHGNEARPPTRRNKTRLAAVSLGVCAGVLALLLFLRLRPVNSHSAAASASVPPVDATTGVPAADQLLARAHAIMNRWDYTQEGMTLATDLAQRATDAAPESAAAWATRALANAIFVQRGWDLSERRHATVQAAANRALALDPANVDAMLALAINVTLPDPGEAESLARQAIKLRPDDPRLYRVVGEALLVRRQYLPRLDYLKDVAWRFPNDALTAYDLGRAYRDLDEPNVPLALEQFERSIRLAGELPSAEVEIAHLLAVEGNYAGADAMLSRLPATYRSNIRAVVVEMREGLLERQPERTIQAAAVTSTDYLDDFVFRGPTAWMVALAYRLKGNAAAEVHEWKVAEAVMRKRLAADPLNADDHADLAVTLAWLGRTEEAKQEMAPVEALVKSTRLKAYFYAGLGEATRTAGALDTLVNGETLANYQELLRDPWWDKVRATPPFAALMAQAKARELADKPAGH